jgi:hypothetical protein
MTESPNPAVIDADTLTGDMHPIRRAVLSLGSNLGDRMFALQGAVDALADTPEVWVTGVSGVYETEPVDAPEGSKNFLNAVITLDTTLSARTLLERAHAVEAAYGDGRSSAAGATCAAYSFYVTKNLTTGEGGMLVTDDDGLAADARIRRLHGLDNDAWKRYASGSFGTYELACPGFKCNMTDMQASLGLHQLSRIMRSHARRSEIWDRYNEAFADLPGVRIPPAALDPGAGTRHARHLYALWIDWEEAGFSRGTFVTGLRDRGIGTGWHFPAVHLQRYYRETYGYLPGAFPVAERIADRTISLPLSPALTDQQVERVIASVRAVVRETGARLAEHA